MRLKLAFTMAVALLALGVGNASAADFDVDGGPCPETPGEKQLSRCPTGFVGQEYEVEIESEEGSGCSPGYDYFVLVGSLPPGLTMSRDGVISGTPTTAGFYRFWIHNHDLDYTQGGPGWCIRDDTSEREFSIYVDPVLELENDAVKGATLGQAYSETLTATRLVNLAPRTVTAAPSARFTLQSGALPPGVTLSERGVLSGTPTAEGSYTFSVKAQDGSPFIVKGYTLNVRQRVTLTAPQMPSSEVGVRLQTSFTAAGGTGAYTWSIGSGALPAGVVLDAARGTVAGTPTAAGVFRFDVTATDTEGRAAATAVTLTVAPRLAVRTLRVKAAKVGRAFRSKLVAAGGVQPVTWSIVRGKLPSGLRLASKTGLVTGTPRRSGRASVTIAVRDALGVRSVRTLRFVVAS